MTSKHVTDGTVGLVPLQRLVRASTEAEAAMRRPESYIKDPTNLPDALITCAWTLCRLSARAFMPLQA